MPDALSAKQYGIMLRIVSSLNGCSGLCTVTVTAAYALLLLMAGLWTCRAEAAEFDDKISAAKIQYICKSFVV
jgi:hypothetical protein